MTEAEISQSLRENNQTGIEFLFNSNYKSLCSYACRFLNNKVAAEETVQQAFLKLWEIRSELSIKESYTAYLFQCVKNNCLNYIKHQQIISKHNEKLANEYINQEANLLLSQETGLSVYLYKELEDKITEAIALLPEQCREIFMLSRFEGLKHAEIAAKKNVTVHTVQKQISIAIEKIKNHLSNYITVSNLLITVAYLKNIKFF